MSSERHSLFIHIHHLYIFVDISPEMFRAPVNIFWQACENEVGGPRPGGRSSPLQQDERPGNRGALGQNPCKSRITLRRRSMWSAIHGPRSGPEPLHHPHCKRPRPMPRRRCHVLSQRVSMADCPRGRQSRPVESHYSTPIYMYIAIPVILHS